MAGVRPSPDLVVRRKMRKGTHSCFECRRRKIRCIYSNDNPNVCNECFARGSRCIDQENASPEAIVDHRKNLRERVSRLESLVDQLLDDKSERGAAETLRHLKDSFGHGPLAADATPSAAGGSQQTPLMSLFGDDVLSRAERRVSDDSSVSGGDDLGMPSMSGQTLNGTTIDFHCEGAPSSNPFISVGASKEKHDRVKCALLSSLPPLHRILEIFATNGGWWYSFSHKCPSVSTKYPSLIDFTNHAYTNGSPPQVGVLALAVGLSLDGDDLEKYLTLVDRWVLSDDEYASTLDGMECMVLQAKCYADIGQPRKAWLLYRRGLVFAQLLGFHRNHSLSPERDSIWWVLFAGDRFMSLLLGLPYGIADSHCDLELKGPLADPSTSHFSFMVNVSIMAGKVIDRCQTCKGPITDSLPSALELDAQLDDVAAKVPPNWWDINALVADSHRPQAALELRERVLAQMAFHQVRVFLHLPFMLGSAANPRFEYSRETCLNSSREILRLYQFLRAGNGEPLYECKAVDFIGFTSAMLLVLGLLGYGRLNPVSKPQQEESDWRVIEICMDILQRASSEKGGKVALQSYKVLEQLCQVRHLDCDSTGSEEHSAKIAIPYFGTIQVRRGRRFNSQSTKSAANLQRPTPPSTVCANSPRPSINLFNTNPGNPNHCLTPPLSTHSQGTPTGTSTSSPQQPFAQDPFISYDGFYMPSNSFIQSTQQIAGEDGLLNLAVTGQWGTGVPLGMAGSNMDIDQDWSMFLTDQNTMGQSGLSGGPGQQQQQDIIPQNGAQGSGQSFFMLG